MSGVTKCNGTRSDSKPISVSELQSFIYLGDSSTRACNGMEWNGMEDGMEEEFWYGIWKTSGMERNGRF